MDNKLNNLDDEEDMQVENILASLYSSSKNESSYKDLTVSGNKEEHNKQTLFDAVEKDKNINISEIDKTTDIGKLNNKDAVASSENFLDLNDSDYKEKGYSDNLNNEDNLPFHPEFEEPLDAPLTSINSTKVKKVNSRLIKEHKKYIKRKQITRTFTHIFGSILLLVFIISVSAFLSYYIVSVALDFTGITANEFEIELEIPEHATTEEIADILTHSGIINMPQFFTFYSRVSDSDGKYLNGLFKLDSTMSYTSIISSLQKINKIKETVTVRIREGMTAKEIGLLLEENFICKASDFEYYYKNKQNKYNFEKRVLLSSSKFYQLEGYLFPDTYEFYIVDDLSEGKDIDTSSYAEIAANKIYSNYNSKITKEMYKRINEMGFTLDEFMTLASMVQAEAGTEEDMLLVASVFLNRIKNSSVFPKLQSDVTILYAENVIRPNVTLRNEGLYNPIIKAYNTYETDGLPPGPICNPGLTAMESVLNALETDYYYFCANVETLEMFYASSIQEHEANLVIAGLA